MYATISMMKTYNSCSSQNKESPEHRGQDESNANIDRVIHSLIISQRWKILQPNYFSNHP